MAFLATLVAATLLTILLRKVIKKAAWALYLLAILACVLSLWLYALAAPERPAWLGGFYFVMRRGYLALALFTIVMFIGAFADGSRADRMLHPIRAELSIIAAILIVGHFVPYLLGYFELVIGSTGIRGSIVFSLAVSLVLLVLLVVLTATSFNWFKKHMSAGSWKGIQKLAYLFFVLVFVHLMGFLLPAALQGSTVALSSIVVYGALLTTYVILRVFKALRSRSAATSYCIT
jgi:DMSO/TMAO reductase YedYZ heme-binding membrane subunit